MTNSVSLFGLFAPPPGARDAKVSEDSVLASFAGVLASVTHVNAKLFVPAPQVEVRDGNDVLENTEEHVSAADSTKADDASDTSAVPVSTIAPDPASTLPLAVNSSVAALNPVLQEKLAGVISRMRDETGHDVCVAETHRSQTRQNVLYAQRRETAGANQEGLRTLGAKDPGHLELPSTKAAANQASNDVISVPDEPDASGPRQVSVARLAQIAQVATVEQVISVAGSPREAKLSPTTYMKSIEPPDAKAAIPARVANTTGAKKVDVIHGDIPLPRTGEEDAFAQSATVFAQADGASDAPRTWPHTDAAIPAKIVARGEITIADATGASDENDSPPPHPATVTMPSSEAPVRLPHKSLEISNLDRLSDAVNATRVAPRAQPRVGVHVAPDQQPRATQSPAKPQTIGGAVQFFASNIGRSATDGQSASSDRQPTDRNPTGYSTIGLRSEATPQFSVTDVGTEMTSTASQRAERIMAAQDAPARPLSQIVMSVDAGNGSADRIQVALRGSTVSATIDASDHHVANTMRAHSDELVRSLTRDGVDVDSLRVRTTAATTTAPVATVDSSQKSSDSSGNSRFNRDAQWDQHRSQQRSSHERRHQQRDQRGGKQS